MSIVYLVCQSNELAYTCKIQPHTLECKYSNGHHSFWPEKRENKQNTTIKLPSAFCCLFF